MIGRQRDQVVEDAGLGGGIALEGADALVGFLRQFAAIIIDAHQPGAIIGAHVLAGRNIGIIDLLAEIQRPVEAGRVVVNQLGGGDHLADAVHHSGDLADVRLFGFDPQQVGTVLQAVDAVEHAAILARTGAELEQVRRQPLRPQQLAIAADDNVAVANLADVDFLAIEEAVVLVANVARLTAEGDLLGQAGAKAVGAGDDDAVFHAQFQECVTDGADLGDEVLVRHGHLAILVAALLFVRHLIFDLQRASAGFDHLLGQQIGGFRVAETGIDVGDDRHHVRLEIVDLVLDRLSLHGISGGAGCIEIAEQAAQLAGIGLAQEGVELLDQRRHAGLFVHRLVGQRAEFAAQRGDHPARKIEVALVGGAEMLLDRNQLLLADEAVPAAQRLGVAGGIGVIGGHVAAHDRGGVTRDVEAGLEAVLQAHAGNAFGADRFPAGLAIDGGRGGLDLRLIAHGHSFARAIGGVWGGPAGKTCQRPALGLTPGQPDSVKESCVNVSVWLLLTVNL